MPLQIAKVRKNLQQVTLGLKLQIQMPIQSQLVVAGILSQSQNLQVVDGTLNWMKKKNNPSLIHGQTLLPPILPKIKVDGEVIRAKKKKKYKIRRTNGIK